MLNVPADWLDKAYEMWAFANELDIDTDELSDIKKEFRDRATDE